MTDIDESLQCGTGELDWIDRAEIDGVESEGNSDDGHITRPWDPSLIRVDPRPLSVQQALDMIDDGDLELQPEFQRRRVWRPDQKSLLIESLLLRIPLPAFYFAADDNGHLQVIDGLQRLSTIHEFVRGGADGTKRFKLSKLEYLAKNVGGKTFDELKGQVWSRRILQASLVANVVDPQTPTAVKFNIFARLNRQGTPLSQQELRHAMSGNRSRHFLSELAQLDAFHAATGSALRDSKRMHDIEMALRFCAFQFNRYASFREFDSLSDFLTKATGSLDDPSVISDSDLDELRTGFLLAMSNAFTVFGKDGFRKRSETPINKPLYEVWSYVLSKLTEFQAAEFAETLRYVRLATLEGDPMFMSSISLNTGSASNVEYRFASTIADLKDLGVAVD